jgi:hypothetical protein
VVVLSGGPAAWRSLIAVIVIDSPAAKQAEERQLHEVGEVNRFTE